MTAFLVDWLNLLVRWGHIIAGIGWIGTSFYFIALDMSLKRREGMRPGVAGTAWEVHGGGFYQVEKYSVAPGELPGDLIWYRWEAYLTWVTGFALMVVQYYANPSAWLIDPQVMALASWQAIAISVASLAVGWFVYDGLCRSPLGRNAVVLAGAVFVLILAAAYFYTHVFSGRSALIHVGAFVGTIMAANVFGIIIPNQKKVVDALLLGQEPDAKYGEVGKQRSEHNTYLTLPVLVLMVSGHYPMLTGHPQAWLLVGLIMVAGGSARFFLVGHEVGKAFGKIAWAAGLAALALGLAVWVTVPIQSGGDTEVADERVLGIMQTHCTNCHAVKPVFAGFAAPPKDVVLQNLDDLRRYALLVSQHAVQTKSMPLGNMTGMSDEERGLLGAWLASQ